VTPAGIAQQRHLSAGHRRHNAVRARVTASCATTRVTLIFSSQRFSEAIA